MLQSIHEQKQLSKPANDAASSQKKRSRDEGNSCKERDSSSNKRQRMQGGVERYAAGNRLRAGAVEDRAAEQDTAVPNVPASVVPASAIAAAAVSALPFSGPMTRSRLTALLRENSGGGGVCGGGSNRIGDGAGGGEGEGHRCSGGGGGGGRSLRAARR